MEKDWKKVLADTNKELESKNARLSVTTDDGELYHVVREFEDENGEWKRIFYCVNSQESELEDKLKGALETMHTILQRVQIAKERKVEARKPQEMLVTFTITAKVSTKHYDNVSEAIAEMDFAPRGGNVSDWHYEDPYMEEA